MQSSLIFAFLTLFFFTITFSQLTENAIKTVVQQTDLKQSFTFTTNKDVLKNYQIEVEFDSRIKVEELKPVIVLEQKESTINLNYDKYGEISTFNFSSSRVNINAWYQKKNYHSLQLASNAIQKDQQWYVTVFLFQKYTDESVKDSSISYSIKLNSQESDLFCPQNCMDGQNGVCLTSLGVCECNSGFIDDDCSQPAYKLSETALAKSLSPSSQYFYIDLEEYNEGDIQINLNVLGQLEDKTIIYGNQKVTQSFEENIFLPYRYYYWSNTEYETSFTRSSNEKLWILQFYTENTSQDITISLKINTSTQIDPDDKPDSGDSGDGDTDNGISNLAPSNSYDNDDDQKEEADSKTKSYIWILVAVGGTFIVLLIVLLVIVRCKRSAQRQGRASPRIQSLDNNVNVIPIHHHQQLQQQQQQVDIKEEEYLSIINEAMPAFIYQGQIDEKNNETQIAFDSCVICLGTLQASEQCRTTICHHHYHKECIDCWLKKQKNCPYCRENLSYESLKKYLEQNRV